MVDGTPPTDEPPQPRRGKVGRPKKGTEDQALANKQPWKELDVSPRTFYRMRERARKAAKSGK